MPLFVNDGKSPLDAIGSTEHAAIDHSAITGVPAASKLTVLSKQVGQVGTSLSYVVTGGTLGVNGDRLEITANRMQTGNAGNVTVTYGGVTLATVASGTVSDNLIEVKIWRTGASAGRYTVKVFDASTGGTLEGFTFGTLALDNSVAQTLDVAHNGGNISELEVLKVAA